MCVCCVQQLGWHELFVGKCSVLIVPRSFLVLRLCALSKEKIIKAIFHHKLVRVMARINFSIKCLENYFAIFNLKIIQ